MDGSMSASPDATVAPDEGIPLDLAPSLSSYRQHTNLTIRIEHLPPSARLSKGRNNGDHSWTVTPDELEGLRYLPPVGTDRLPALTVKVISLDDDYASTLVQFDFPVSIAAPPVGAVTDSTADGNDEPEPENTASPAADTVERETELARLARELDKLNDNLAAAKLAHADEIATLRDHHASVLQVQAAEAEKRLSRETARQVSDARAAWEAEQEYRVETAVQEAVRTTETEIRTQVERTNETGFADEIARRLEEARVLWQTEQQSLVQAAVRDAVHGAEADAAHRLAEAETQWRTDAERQLADLSTRATQAEAALETVRQQSNAAGDVENALRDELASAQDMLQVRTTELEEARRRMDGIAADMARREENATAPEASSPREVDLEFRLKAAIAEADAQLEVSRAEWRREREEILLRSEENAEQRVRQSLEQWQAETQAAMARAKQAWEAGENVRLANAKTHWNEMTRTTRSRNMVADVAKRKRRSVFTGRFGCWAAVAACVAAAVMLYPRVEPMVAERWWPKVVAYKSEIEPTLREAGAQLQSQLSEVVNGPERRATVDVPVANVRAAPSTSSAVITRLPRESEVVLLERQGSWMRVRIGGRNGVIGWLHDSLLKDL